MSSFEEVKATVDRGMEQTEASDQPLASALHIIDQNIEVMGTSLEMMKTTSKHAASAASTAGKCAQNLAGVDGALLHIDETLESIEAVHRSAVNSTEEAKTLTEQAAGNIEDNYTLGLIGLTNAAATNTRTALSLYKEAITGSNSEQASNLKEKATTHHANTEASIESGAQLEEEKETLVETIREASDDLKALEDEMTMTNNEIAAVRLSVAGLRGRIRQIQEQIAGQQMTLRGMLEVHGAIGKTERDVGDMILGLKTNHSVFEDTQKDGDQTINAALEFKQALR